MADYDLFTSGGAVMPEAMPSPGMTPGLGDNNPLKKLMEAIMGPTASPTTSTPFAAGMEMIQNPDQVAAAAAAQGIPPPKFPPPLAPLGPLEPPGLGPALEPRMMRTSDADPWAGVRGVNEQPSMIGTARPNMMAGITGALKGVTAPPAPQTQRVSSPAAPRPTSTIQGGGLQALLQQLFAAGAGRNAGGMNLPSTLSEALALRRG